MTEVGEPRHNGDQGPAQRRIGPYEQSLRDSGQRSRAHEARRRRRRHIRRVVVAVLLACLVAAGAFGAWRVFGPGASRDPAAESPGTSRPMTCAQPTTVRLAVVPSAVNVVSRLTEALSKRDDSPCADFAIEALDSYAVAAALAGPSAPDAWVTDSQEWVARASALLGRTLTPGTPFASSGVVIAMPRQSAEKLGNQASWTNALTTAGQVRVPDPNRSAVGSAVLGATAPGMSPQSLRDLVTRTSKAGPATLTAAVESSPQAPVAVTAAQLVTYNEQQPDKAMAAVAPVGGAAPIEYSLVSVSDEQPVASIVDKLGAFLTSEQSNDTLAEAGYTVPGKSPARAPTPLYGVITAAQPPSADVLAAVRKEWSAVAPRTRGLLVVSVSGAMLDRIDSGTRLQATQAAILRTTGAMAPQSSLALWAFSVHIGPDGFDYRPLMPHSAIGDVATLRGVAKNVTGLSRSIAGGRALYDTISAAYAHAVAQWQPGADNTVVVLTDGANEDDYGDSLEVLKQRLAGVRDPARPVRLTIIGIGEAAADREPLRSIAASTGGSYESALQGADLAAALAKSLSH